MRLSSVSVLALETAFTCLQDYQQNALAFAYQYGYPLYAYGQFIQGYDGETNTVYRGQSLATAQNRSLVRPNVDTIYSTIFYDLSEADLEFTVPEFDDRYWLIPFYDIYGNDFGNIGSLQGHKPGKYLLRLTENDFGVQTEQVPEPYQAYVNSPTTSGLSLIRILVQDSTTDLERVIKYENGITVQPVNRTNNANAPKLDLGLFRRLMQNSSLDHAEIVLQLTAALADSNQPEVLGDRSWVATTLKNAGISGGYFTQPEGTNLTAAAAVANASAANIRTLAGMTDQLGNNWTKTAPQILGDYGSYYNGRHVTALRGYLALTLDQAIYPVYTAGNPNIAYQYSIGPDQAYLVTFSAKPALKSTGFWSVTAYGADSYLIPNDLNRYVLGDRSNLTYSDGSLLSSSNETNREFQILLQPSDVSPPENWTNNWLPAPSGGGNFSFNLRFYGAESSLSNGSYVYPLVELIDAIRK